MEKRDYSDSDEFPNYNVLVMGSTGAGKSTLVNTIINLASGRSFRDARLFGIPVNYKAPKSSYQHHFSCNVAKHMHHQIELEKSVGQSDTKFVNMFDIDIGGATLTLIDTPGFGDTRGPQQDATNAQMIIDKLSKVLTVHAVIWVSKSSLNRNTAELKYSVELFLSMLPVGYNKNIFLAFTHCPSMNGVNAPEILKGLSLPMENAFYFENECLMPYDLARTFAKSLGEDEDDHVTSLEYHWKKNKNQFNSMIALIKKIDPCCSNEIVMLDIKKKAIEKLLNYYQTLLSDIDDKSRKIKNLEFAKKVTLDQKSQVMKDTIKTSQLEKKYKKKKFLGIFPYKKKYYEYTTKEEVRDKDQLKRLEKQEEEIKRKSVALASEQDAIRSFVDTFKYPIHYFEQMICRQSMSGTFASNEVENHIDQLIKGKTEESKSGTNNYDSQELERYKNRFMTLKKLLAQTKTKIELKDLPKVSMGLRILVESEGVANPDNYDTVINILTGMESGFEYEGFKTYDQIINAFDAIINFILQAIIFEDMEIEDSD
jgi:hypothetical protein